MVAARSGDCIHMSKANRLRVSRRLSALAKDLRQNSQAGKDASVAAPQTRPVRPPKFTFTPSHFFTPHSNNNLVVFLQQSPAHPSPHRSQFGKLDTLGRCDPPKLHFASDPVESDGANDGSRRCVKLLSPNCTVDLHTQSHFLRS